MSKITKLTEEQVAKLDVYVNEWVAKGLTTERKTQQDAERDFTEFQRHVLKREPSPVILLDSPADCWRVVLQHTLRENDEVKQLLNEKIEKKLALKKNKNAARESIEASIFEEILNDAVKTIPIVYPYFDCQFWAGWFSFYEFCRNELKISFDNITGYTAMLNCQPYGMVWPLDTICVVCQPPTVIERNEHGLHCETGPAVSYNGKNEIYSLNGIIVPKELVTTPAEDLSLDFFAKEKNADVKAEFVRKYGIERMLDLGKRVDSYENYDANTH
ncbi:MAG: hypothetical protein FJ267_02920, partial [Planctomycetes bacterium]|nr:hypothetical protein [Planctomycetota bacterium]